MLLADLGSLLWLRLRFFLNLRQRFNVHLPSSDQRTESGTTQGRLRQLADLRFVLRHTVINQLFDILLRFQSEKKASCAVVSLLTHLSHVIEKLLTG